MKSWIVPVALWMAVPLASAQEQARPPFNSAVGLGGGAGGAFGGRAGGRLTLARRGGEDIARAIEAGLSWLAAQQREDGAWGRGDEADATATGLALLAMLGDGNTLRSGPLRANAKRATQWLREQQDDAGALCAGDPLAQAIATLAMVEVQGLSAYKLLLKDTRRALDALLAARAANGGWTAAGDDPAPTGWAIAALRAANDLGLEVDRGAAEEATNWLANRAGDDPRLTAMTLFVRMLVGGVDAKDATTAAQVQRLLAHPIDAATGDATYWTFASDALYQIGRQPWKEWAAGFEILLDTQRKDGAAAGSWSGVDGGEARATALRVLTLESYYRFSRLRPWSD